MMDLIQNTSSCRETRERERESERKREREWFSDYLKSSFFCSKLFSCWLMKTKKKEKRERNGDM